MAQRINIKFLTLFLVVFACITGGVLAGYFIIYKETAESLAAKGDAMYATPNYPQAVKYYSKAYKEDPANTEYLWKFAQATQKIKYKDTIEVTNALRKVISAWTQIISIAPESEYGQKAQQQLLHFYYLQASHRAVQVSYWDRLYRKADSFLSRNPQNHLARKYRAIAQTQRMALVPLQENMQDQARHDLEETLKVFPDDEKLHYHQAIWHLARAKHYDEIGKTDLQKQHQTSALKVVADYAQAHPDNMTALLNQVDILAKLKQHNQAAKLLQQADQKLFANLDDPDYAYDLATLLQGVFARATDDQDNSLGDQGNKLAVTILTKAHNNHPENLRITYFLSRIHRQLKNQTQAVNFYLDILKDRQLTLSSTANMYQTYQQLVAWELVELYTQQHATADNPQQKAQFLAKAKEIAEQQKDVLRSTPFEDKIQGRIALAEGNYLKSVKHFEDAIKQNPRDVRSLYFVAIALEMLGEVGAAIDRWSLVTEQPLNNEMRTRAFYKLAELNYRLRRYETANRFVDEAIENSPDDPTLAALRSRILAARSAQYSKSDPEQSRRLLQESIKDIESQPNNDTPSMQILLASLYYQAEQSDKAKSIIQNLYQKNPKEQVVIYAMIRFYLMLDQKDKALEFIDQAATHLEDPSTLKNLKDQLTGDFDQQSIIDLLGKEQDDFQRSYRLYRYYLSIGEKEKADQMLAELKRLRANDVAVLEIEFGIALKNKDWDEALKICQKVQQDNLDLAQGAFWFGELEYAQGKFNEAIQSFQRGLELRPLYSDGFQLLGKALLAANRTREAEDAFNRSLEIRPNNTKALVSLFRVYHARGETDKALQQLKLAIKSQPNNRSLQDQYLNYLGTYSDPAAALALRKNYAVRNPKDQSNLRAIVRLHQRMRQWDEAEKVLDTLFNTDPLNLENITLKAVFLKQTQGQASGEALFDQYLKQKADQITIEDYIAFARFLRQSNDNDKTEEVYRKAIALEDPVDLPVTREFADWQFQRKAYQASVPLYKKILLASKDALVHRRLIEALIHAEMFDQAEESLSQYESTTNLDVQVLLLKGLLAEKQGNRQQAEIAYNRAIQSNPNNAQGYLFRARFNIDRSDTASQELVRADLQKAIRNNPKLTPARELLAQWYMDPRRKEYDKAISQLRQILSYDNNSESSRLMLAQAYTLSGNDRALKELIAESTTLFPNNTIWFELEARRLSRMQDNNAAITQLKKIYESNPNPQYLQQYVSALMDVQQYQQAFDYLQQHKTQFTDIPYIKAAEARALVGLNQKNKAMQLFKQAFIEAKSNVTFVDQIFIQVRFALDNEESFKIIKEWEIADKSGMAALILARLYYFQQQPNQSLIWLQKAEKNINPDNTNLIQHYYKLLSGSHYAAKQYEQALNANLKLLELNPDDHNILNNIAYIITEGLNQPARALPYAEKAVELCPQDPQKQAGIYDTLGFVQLQMKDYVKAEFTLRKALAFKPLPMIHIHLGMVYKQTAQNTKAIAEFNSALALADTMEDKQAKSLAQQMLNEIQASTGN